MDNSTNAGYKKGSHIKKIIFLLTNFRAITASLKYGTEKFRANKEIVLMIVAKRALDLKFATDDLRGNREFILKIYKSYEKRFKIATKNTIDYSCHSHFKTYKKV